MEEEEFTFGLLYFYNKTLRDTDLLFYSPLCLPVYSGTDKLLRYNTERHGKQVKKAVLKKNYTWPLPLYLPLSIALLWHQRSNWEATEQGRLREES